MVSGDAAARVAIIGGGLAGLAAASALARCGVPVDLYEARRQFGGRAGSFRDPADGQWVDHCQHVAMGCCTNYLHLCRDLGIDALLRRERTLYFYGAQQRATLRALNWLPAPLHLAPALLRTGYLSWRDKLAIARAMWQLMRLPSDTFDRTATDQARTATASEMTIGRWLVEQRQTPGAIERFWNVVLTSALGESLQRASWRAARKVFIDGFIAAADAYHVVLPTAPLDELYSRAAAQLAERQVTLYRQSRVAAITVRDGAVSGLHMADGTQHTYAAVIAAVAWRQLESLCRGFTDEQVPQLAAARHIESSPITSVHLWFDRPIFDVPHAVVVDRLVQWVFARAVPDMQAQQHYYQVVISASRALQNRAREDVLAEVLEDLRAVWPAAREAQLLRHRWIMQQEAVFSNTPQFDRQRVGQRTGLTNFAVAGDWTETGWPSTMESAVRSGYLAAEAILPAVGQRPRSLLQPDLARSWLARMLVTGEKAERGR